MIANLVIVTLFEEVQFVLLQIKKLLSEGRTMEEMDEIRRLLKKLNEVTIQAVSTRKKEKRNVLEENADYVRIHKL